MTWTVMRRDLDRNVRVVTCATEAEAVKLRHETQRAHPDEASWIEHDDNSLHETRTPMELPKLPTSDVTEIPKARVVSPVHRIEPRRVPWLATIHMIGPTCASIAGLLALIGILVLPQSSRGHSLHVWAPGTESALESIGAVWLGIAVILVFAAAVHQWLFLRRARIVEGVMTNGEIELSVDGAVYRMTSLAPPVAEGTRVLLFVRGLRVVELCKAGARLGSHGEVCWDAVAYPYKATWLNWGIALAVGFIVMLVTVIFGALAG